jgi:hypothetical protein
MAKRANRALLKAVTQQGFRLLMDVWAAHLRWMRFYIAFFKLWPRPFRGRRIRRQEDLDGMLQMAARGIRHRG